MLMMMIVKLGKGGEYFSFESEDSSRKFSATVMNHDNAYSFSCKMISDGRMGYWFIWLSFE